MKTLSNLTSDCTDDGVAFVIPDSAPYNMQATGKFARWIRWTKDFALLESSEGKQVKLPIAEIWKLAEAKEPGLAVPKT